MPTWQVVCSVHTYLVPTFEYEFALMFAQLSHTRVVVGNAYDTNGTVDCAQASSDAAKIRGETLSSFTGEEAFYLLRPAQSR